MLGTILPAAVSGSSGCSSSAVDQAAYIGKLQPVRRRQGRRQVKPAAVPRANNPFGFGGTAAASPVAADRTSTPVKQGRMVGVPVWAWAAAIALLLFALGGGLVAVLMATRTGPNPVAQGPTPNQTNSPPEKPAPTPNQTSPNPVAEGPTPNQTSPNPETHGPTPLPLIAPFTVEEAKRAQAAWAKYLGRKVEEEIDLGGVELVVGLIPPGTFIMGSPKDEKDRNYWENIQRLNGVKSFDAEIPHTVTITKPFYLGK